MASIGTIYHENLVNILFDVDMDLRLLIFESRINEK